MRGRARTVVFSLLPVLTLLALCELTARLVEPWLEPLPADTTLGFSEDSRVFVPDREAPGGMITNPEKIFFFHDMRFIVPKPPGVFRIAVLGESSVNYLEKELRELEAKLGARLGRHQLKVEVINAGGKSYASQRLRIVARELANYGIDLAIVYIGNNEFEELEQLALYSPRTAPLQRLAGHLAFFRLLRDRIARAWIARLEREHDERILSRGPEVRRAETHDFSDAEIEGRMLGFEDNLAAIVETFKAGGARVLLGLVPSNILLPILDKTNVDSFRPIQKLYDEGRFAEARENGMRFVDTMRHRHQASRLERQIIRQVAAAEQTPLFDMEEAVETHEPHGIPGETLFTDNCHLNPKGRALWRDTVEHAIIANGLVPN